MPNVWLGEFVRWYLTRASHPFKNYVVGHYWARFARPSLWVRYEGGVIGIRLGDYLQQRIFFDGCYERGLIEWLKATLQPDDVFWDIGANIGAVTLVAAKRCRRVVAFEPDPRALESLTKNLDANGIKNVEVIAAALGAEPGEATLYQADAANTGMTSLLPGRSAIAGTASVAVVRADDLIATRPELAPTLMKLDVEGAEHLVLGGAPALLQSQSVRAIVFEDRVDAAVRPTNTGLIASLNDARYRIEPFTTSDDHAPAGMSNFLATPATSH